MKRWRKELNWLTVTDIKEFKSGRVYRYDGGRYSFRGKRYQNKEELQAYMRKYFPSISQEVSLFCERCEIRKAAPMYANLKPLK